MVLCDAPAHLWKTFRTNSVSILRKGDRSGWFLVRVEYTEVFGTEFISDWSYTHFGWLHAHQFPLLLGRLNRQYIFQYHALGQSRCQATSGGLWFGGIPNPGLLNSAQNGLRAKPCCLSQLTNPNDKCQTLQLLSDFNLPIIKNWPDWVGNIASC